MNLIVRGKNFPLTDANRSYVSKQFEPLGRRWPTIRRVTVTCSVEPTRGAESRRHVEGSVLVGGMLFHGEERAADLHVAIDGLVEKLERQLDRKRGQMRDREGAAIWPEPTRHEPESLLILLRPENVEAGEGAAVMFGSLPNLLGWSVVGPQDKQVGSVTGLYVHLDTDEIADLLVATADREFTVPIAEVSVNTDQECVQLRRNLGQIPRAPAEVLHVETPLRTFLEAHDVPEPIIERLEAYGVRTPRDLRTRVEEGRLESLLGDASRRDLRDIERLIEEAQ